MTNTIESIVTAALDGASDALIEDVAAHGIHNITNDYHGDSDEEYEAFSDEFTRQAEAALLVIEARRLADARYRADRAKK